MRACLDCGRLRLRAVLLSGTRPWTATDDFLRLRSVLGLRSILGAASLDCAGSFGAASRSFSSAASACCRASSVFAAPVWALASSRRWPSFFMSEASRSLRSASCFAVCCCDASGLLAARAESASFRCCCARSFASSVSVCIEPSIAARRSISALFSSCSRRRCCCALRSLSDCWASSFESCCAAP